MSPPANQTVIRWLQDQIDALQQRHQLLLGLLAEAQGAGATPQAIAPALNTPTTRAKAGKMAPSHVKTLEILKQAGPEGLSAADLSTLESIPLGTASSRLSIIKTAGYANLNHHNHRYFAIHSQPQDNNSSEAHP